ncbi:MAG: ABC transporter ATP-binding protein [Deltaproteobacteria bacterium]|nr:ABC transporter ATP-binding protein [Deltaproteobacteria bacterium]
MENTVAIASPVENPAAEPPLAVEARGLVKRFGRVRALDGLDLRLRTGEIYGFLGPNGAGKTTTIRILTGLLRPDRGEARVGGADVVRNPVAAKAQIGVVSQQLNLDPDLTVAESLELHGILHGMPRAERRARARELLEFAGLADRAGSLGRTLSGGMKRRVTIVRALLHEPRILFLDEPTVGLDPATRRRLWDLIRSVNRRGVTVLLTTHYIEEAEFLCHRVGILDRGRLIEEGTPRELLEGLGEYAVDLVEEGGTRTRFFPTREAALAFLRQDRAGAGLRRTNLEDLFLQRTGRRVDP